MFCCHFSKIANVATEMGYFKPFFHLILYVQQPDRTAPIHYDFSTAKLIFLYHLQPLDSREIKHRTTP